MTKIGLIGGTAAEFEAEWLEDLSIDTPWGPVTMHRGRMAEVEVLFVRRHGAGHTRLSSQVLHRENVWALKEAGCSAIIGTTVCGVVDGEVELGTAIVFDDLFFPDNRLPDGSPCTVYDTPGDERRGHFIFGSPFSSTLRGALLDAATDAGVAALARGVYAYMLGPRFNTRTEIAWLRSLGVTAVSQTAGPEAVLAGELEVPYALVGFGVDYANGVKAEPTPVDVLDANIAASRRVFGQIVPGALRRLGEHPFDTGFVYRFE
ncbi:MAG: MTAP family purine nucleoside phosphorylase [Anaerosomatales bacterium]|nr:MTAP family purine nucleoside phosphorylase [Anaerosomatales bacterium]MDT8434213.1 MTAP family purine nucleoside phosphorylase [Anaerosomatales bacterium]